MKKMLKLSDFKRGQIVCAVEEHEYTDVNVSGGGGYTGVEEYEVISVGRKYVTARPRIGGREYQFQISKGDPWFLIHADNGVIFLFPSRRAYEEHREMYKLRTKIKRIIFLWPNSTAFEALSLEKLKTIVGWLEHPE